MGNDREWTQLAYRIRLAPAMVKPPLSSCRRHLRQRRHELLSLYSGIEGYLVYGLLAGGRISGWPTGAST